MFFLAFEASAQDACHDVLTTGFYAEYAKSDAKVRDRSLYAELCSLNYEQAQAAIKSARASGDDGTLGLSFGLFALDAMESRRAWFSALVHRRPSLSEGRFRQWKAGYCSKNSELESAQAAEFLIQTAIPGKAPGSVATAKALETWSSCMKKREGLTCWASPRAPQGEEFVLNVNWTKNSGKESQSRPRCSIHILPEGGNRKFEGAPAQRVLPAGHKWLQARPRLRLRDPRTKDCCRDTGEPCGNGTELQGVYARRFRFYPVGALR